MKNFLFKLFRLLTDSRYRFIIMNSFGYYKSMSDEAFLKRMFLVKMGRELNLKSPTTFSEKLQWLKLYNRKPEYTIMVDKLKVREYISEVIGEKYLIPLLGVWDNPEEIDFEQLPNQFVLKCNHNSGKGMCICKDKNYLNERKVKYNLQKGLEEDYYMSEREWPYKDVPRKVICEQYMVDESGTELKDYKFFCFNGEPKYCQVIAGRETAMTIDFFDLEWRHQNFHEPRNYPFSNSMIPKPINYKLMIQLARRLSKGIPFVRVDFYNICGHVYFGEITFFPTAGLGGFDPEIWDYKFGRMIDLNGINM